MSKVLWREVSDLNITVEVGGKENNLIVNVDVEVGNSWISWPSSEATSA